MALFKCVTSGKYGKLEPKGLFMWFLHQGTQTSNIVAQGSNRLPLENLDRFLRKRGSVTLQRHLKLFYWNFLIFAFNSVYFLLLLLYF